MIGSNGHGNTKGDLANWAIKYSKCGSVISGGFSSRLVCAIPNFVLLNANFKYGILRNLTCLLANSLKCHYFIA